MPDVLAALAAWYAGMPDLDEVAILRVAYTVAAAMGLPCALWCTYASRQSWLTIRRKGLNGGLDRIARGYRRRDTYRLGVLALIVSAGLIALSGSLPLRSVFGLVVLLVIAVWTTHSSIADYQDRRATVDREVHP